MITYAPNISWLFSEMPFVDRPRAVAEAGFEAIEFGFYGSIDLELLKQAKIDFGLEIALFNMDIPEWDEHNRGYLADPASTDIFMRALDDSLQVAIDIEAKKMWVPAGARNPKMIIREQVDCILRNLEYAAPLAADAGVILCLEVLNPKDISNYLLSSSEMAAQIIRLIDQPYIKYQFDTYHIQTLQGNLIQTLTEDIDAIGHFQYGDVPGRIQPGRGEINFQNVESAIEKAGYSSYIGLEFTPARDDRDYLDWVPIERRRIGKLD